jgi:hypothetical protein
MLPDLYLEFFFVSNKFLGFEGKKIEFTKKETTRHGLQRFFVRFELTLIQLFTFFEKF